MKKKNERKKVEVGATPFALCVVVLSTTHTRSLPRRGPGLHDTDFKNLRQLGGTVLEVCGRRFWKPWRTSRPMDPLLTA
jgi:hypothetical protein